MASGGKQMVTNTQERAVSTDVNRLQAFSSYDRAELFRNMLNVSMGTDDYDAGDAYLPVTTLGSPLAASIFNGYQVQPQVGAGTFDLLVTTGVMYALNPDAAPDDSNYKLVVRDPGIPSTGSLLMTGNSSGSTRIDVIECSLNPTISETDNRDIFNPLTGLFSATSVTKAVETHLTYRVRQGTPGSGFPGVASGWLPLAVASVPAGATTNDSMIFWDVRPMAAHRHYAPFNLKREVARVDSNFTIDLATSPSWLFRGSAEAGAVDLTVSPADASLGRIGGIFTSYDNHTSALDLNSSAYISGVLGTGPVYLYLATPFGLPNWARYSNAAFGSRRPFSPRGLPILSATAPTSTSSSPSSALTIPTALGLGGTTGKAACVGVFHATGSVIDQSFISSHSKQISGSGSALCFATAPAVLSGGSQVATYTFTHATHFPPNALGLYIQFQHTWNTASAEYVQIQHVLQDGFGNNPIVLGNEAFSLPGSGGPQVTNYVLYIPRQTTTADFAIVATILNSAAYNTSGAIVVGWEL